MPPQPLARVQSVYVRLPAGAPPDRGSATRPYDVLVALHGMGGNGEDFGRELIEQADLNRWVIVAPTIQYGDWRDPAQIAREDPALIRWLSEYLDNVPDLIGVPVRKRVFLLGHSRGAQLAHRFALFRPDRVNAVAALAAGTYTLPTRTAQGKALQFPYGVADLSTLSGRPFDQANLSHVQFWIGVGSDDNNPLDLPRSWDAYIGSNRVQRAQAFQASMKQLGAPSVLALFKNVKHDVTTEMRTAACAFLGGIRGGPRDVVPVSYRHGGALMIPF